MSQCIECGTTGTLYRDEDWRGGSILLCWSCYSGEPREDEE